MGEKKILVIAPHADDEVLGCGGYLLHERDRGSEIHLIVGAIGGEDCRQNIDIRKREFDDVCRALGANGYVLEYGKDALLDTVPSRNIITALDRIVDNVRPDVVLINCISHHQDHRKMYDCAMAAMRKRDGFFTQCVMLYEYPCLEPGEVVDGGRCYHDISDVINDKVQLLNLYSSQVRNAPSPINENGIRSLASIRGQECGGCYAELFYIQREVI